tara:strand:- start:1012 stop:1254 length:243 start_codon:yes stop_codon:yes gene_type:complete
MKQNILNDLFDKQLSYLSDKTFTININGKEIINLNSSYNLLNENQVIEKYKRDLEYETKRKKGELKWQKNCYKKSKSEEV